MNILLETHPLGTATYDQRNKTGVYRVVEHLAVGLAETAHRLDDSLQVTFHAADCSWQARRYFQDRLRGPHTRFAARPAQTALARGADLLQRFAYRTRESLHLSLRFLRRAATRCAAPMERLATRLDRRVLKEVDVYHSPFLPIPGSVRAQRRPHCFATIYDLIPLTNPQWFDENLVGLLRKVVASLKPEDYVMCISHATRRSLLEHAPQLAPERAIVTHLAAGDWCRPELDGAKIGAVRARFGLERDTPYFLSVCTLEPRKNMGALIQAFARLRRAREIGPEFRLVLVGGVGWKTDKIASALEDVPDCREAIVLTGFVPDEELPSLYSGARAFVYMSRLEGFGLPPLEAMQCGAPVITSDSSSLPEVVGDAGIMLAPDDLDGLCSAMLSLVKDDALHRDLSARALQRATLFSWERFVQQHLSAYRAALAM